MQGFDRNLGDVDATAGRLLPMGHVIFQAVTHCRFEHHDVDGGALVGLGLNEIETLLGDGGLPGGVG